MPISRQRFDEAPDERVVCAAAADRVTAFLGSHPDEAFAEEEVTAALQDGWPEEFPSVLVALASALPLVKTNLVGGKRYFRIT